MSINIFEYNTTPEETLYVNFISSSNKPFVENSIQIESQILPIAWLFEKINNGTIASLSPYLQRILLTKVWKAYGFLKSKSYVRDLWKGLGKTTPFFLVPIDLVLMNIELAEKENKNPDIAHQITEVKNQILQFVKDKVKFINLDGQTRSKESIVPYLKSEFNLISTENARGLSVLNEDGTYVDISSKLFSELDAIQRGKFLTTEVIVNLLTEGKLDDITNALISINSNEKWTKWQEYYHGTWISVFPKRIHEVIEVGESGPVKDFFAKRVATTPTYREEISGWEHFIAEQLYFLKNHSHASLNDLKNVLKQNGVVVPTNEQSTKLCGYINELIDDYTSDTKLTHQFVSNWCLFRDILDNYSNKNDSYFLSFTIPKMNILSVSSLFTWFTKKIQTLESRWIVVDESDENSPKILNDKSYQYDTNKQIVKKANSWPSHKDGGYKLASTIGRMRILINELTIDFKQLEKDRVITTTTTMAPKSEVFASNGFKSNVGKIINPTKSSADKYERGHIQSRKNEGTDDALNLSPQIKTANRKYSGKNMIK